jgi:hypothetical protein
MSVIETEHNATFEVTDLPVSYRRRHRVLTEAGLAAEQRTKPVNSGSRPTTPWLAHVRPTRTGSQWEMTADHVVTLGQPIAVEGRRYTIEMNTAGDNCWLAPLS